MTDAATRGPGGSFDSTAFRRTLGSFATGVVVVAAQDGTGPVGMAANSFTSVSLDPPLVLFCAANSSTTWPRIRGVGGFSISVLAADQEDVCRGFSRRGIDRFADVTWLPGPAGHPVISGALAWLDCRLDALHPAGDHEIVVARVLSIPPQADGGSTGVPLVFFRGQYSGLPVEP